MEPKVLISILNWNQPEITIECIQSMFEGEYNSFEIIVLDNSSHPSTIITDFVNQNNLRYIPLESNLGYAGAHGLSADLVLKENFDALWILNNDLVVEKDTLYALIKSHIAHPNAILGSVSLEANDNDTINFAGGWEVGNRGGMDYATPYNQWMKKSWKEVGHCIQERQVMDINGCSMLIPKNVLLNQGYMEKGFFLYKEETDYCFTLAEKGIERWIVPTSKVYHRIGASFTNPRLEEVKNYYMERNMMLFLKRHPTYFPKPKNPLKRWVPRLTNALRLFYFSLFKSRYSLAYYKALGKNHGYRGIMGKTLAPEKFIRS